MPFTGAGISTECGIPDFRSPGGLWTKNRPIEFDDFLASQEMRDEVLAAAFRHGASISPPPGPAAATARWPASTAPARCPALVTQNIDNLHQASGIDAGDIVELHGNTTYATCLYCARRYELAWVREQFERGGGHARRLRLRRLHQDRDGLVRPGDAGATRCGARENLSRDCDLFLAIGSSLVVWPAAGFPLMAKRNGAALVIINREPTEFDDIADLVVRDDIGDAARALHRPLIRARATLCTGCAQATFCILCRAQARCYLELTEIRSKRP